MRLCALLSLVLVACGTAKGDRATEAPAPAPAPATEHADEADEADEAVEGEKAPDWVAAEHKRGASRWKDTGVYVDGKPVGVLAFGELPLALEPTWVDDEISVPVKPGQRSVGKATTKQRRYRFIDYLKAVGVDLARVRELHIYGPRFSETVMVTGEQLRGPHGAELMFRFGGEIWGKALPVVPFAFNTRSPDKISAVLVYVDKEPPVLIRNKGMSLGGEIIRDVPYFGEPMRGGIRLYLDDLLVAQIKRRTLEKQADGVARNKLVDFLVADGVDVSRIKEGWVIRDELRRERLSRADIDQARFEAGAQAKGAVTLIVGDRRILANHIAFHSRELAPDELPKVLPHEDPYD